MQKEFEKEETSEVLENLERKQKIKKFLIVAIISVLLVIVIFISFSFYNYFQSPEKTLGIGANIESALLNEQGNLVYVKLLGGSLDKNITKIKFIFTDAEGKEYVYETTEGIKEIEVPYTKTFWDILLGFFGKKPDYLGVYNYDISAGDLGIENFNAINEVGVLFEYETGSGEIIETPVLDTTKPTATKTTTGGGGDGGTTTLPPVETCTNDTGCSLGGNFCDNNLNLPYNCSLNISDGCLDRVNRIECGSGYYCDAGACKQGNVYYVREGATGNGNGSDWTNAYTTPPASLERGATYYIADGNYSSYIFDDVEDGNKYIYIKKAIISEHGTDVGWQNSYGDGIAQFIRIWFRTSYWIFDGQTGGGPGSWESGHGFKIKGIEISFSYSVYDRVDFISIKHVEVEGLGLDTGNSDGGIYSFGNNESDSDTNINISYCYLHDFGGVPIYITYGKNWIIEYNYITRNSNYPQTKHSEGLANVGSDNIIIRYNIWSDIEGTAFIANLGENVLSENWEIYGNLFYYTDGNPYNRIGTGTGIIGASDTRLENNIKFYNNVIVNIPIGKSGIFLYTGPLNGNEVYNNLWYKANDTNSVNHHDVTHDYNVYINTSLSWAVNPSGNDTVTTEDIDPFVDWKNKDFRLKAPTAPGINFSWMNNKDMFGNIRGADGNWDRGAIEYVEAPAVQKTNNISQYNITWYFDKEYQYGNFANGDYWVVGPVTITNISPCWNGQSHGSMKNPMPIPNSQQAYDSRIGGYTANLLVEAPVTIEPNTSLISSISWTDADVNDPNYPAVKGPPPRPTLRAAAVLTVLGTVPPDNGATVFRPPYAGNDKPLYSTADLRKELLPNLALVPNTPNIHTVEHDFERVWLDHFSHVGDGTQYTSPSENMPWNGVIYSERIGRAALLLMLNEAELISQQGSNKDVLLRRFVQLGIDLYGVVENGGYWQGQGSLNTGRKWPILFAGIMLNHSGMKNIGTTSPSMTYQGFQEDSQVFYVTGHPNPNSVWTFNSVYWESDGTDEDYDIYIPNPYPSLDPNPGNFDAQGYRLHYFYDPPNGPYYGHGDAYAEATEYTEAHRGMPEWGIDHGDGYSSRDNLDWVAAYRDANGMSYPGFILAAHIMGQKSAWNHGALFDFTDRWVEVHNQYYSDLESMRGYFVYGGDFQKDMWNAYRNYYDCVWTRDDNPNCHYFGNCIDITNSSWAGSQCDSNSSCYSNGHYDCTGCLYNCLSSPYCGDGFCNGGETPASCFYDCPCLDGEKRNCSKQLGVCAGSFETCVGSVWPRCDYSAWSIYYDGDTEIRCGDFYDNDCDGTTDCSDTDCSTDPACATAIPSDYISYWKFEGNANDEKGVNNGTIQGNPQYVSRMQGQALSFNGDGDYIELGSPASLRLNNALSISAWVKANSISTNTIFTRGYCSSSAENMKYSLIIYSSAFRMRVSNGTTSPFSDSSTITTNTWYHVVGTYNGIDTVNLYVNGILNKSTYSANLGSLNDNGQTLGTYISMDNDVARYYFNGSIDEVMIYNRALNETEILQIYNSQKPQLPAENNFYVSVSGNGSKNGSSQSNAMNLSQAQVYANSHLNDEITFLLESGSYGNFADYTERTAWVTYKADTSQQPKIDSLYFQFVSDNPDDWKKLYIKFEGLKFVGEGGSYKTAAWFYGAKYVKFTNCEFISNGYRGTFGSVHDTGLYIRRSQYFEINNCTFRGSNPNSEEGGYQTAIWGQQSSMDIIVNNSNFDGNRFGVVLSESDTGTMRNKRWTIENSKFYNIDSDGIIFQGTEDCVIQNNYLYHMTTPMYDFTFTKNATFVNDTLTLTVDPADGEPFRNWTGGGYPNNGLEEWWVRITLDNGTRVPDMDGPPEGNWSSTNAYETYWSKIASHDGNTLTFHQDKNRFLQDYNNIKRIDVLAHYHNDFIQFQGMEYRPIIRRNVMYNSTHQAMQLWPSYAEDLLIEGNVAYDTAVIIANIGNIRNVIMRDNTFLLGDGIVFRSGSSVKECSNNIFDSLAFMNGMYKVPNYDNDSVEDYNILRIWPTEHQNENFTPGNHTIFYYSGNHSKAWDSLKGLFLNYDEKNFSPIITGDACNGSLNSLGVAVGALPCICTTNQQCIDVFGSQYICDIPTGNCCEDTNSDGVCDILSSLSPFTRVWSFLKSLLTGKTGNAILTGKITGDAVNETNENGESKIPYIILSVFVVIILIIAIVIVKNKKKKKKFGKR